MYYYKSNRFGGILSLSGYLRTVVFSCDSHLGVLSRRGLVCNSLDNGGPGVLTTWVASISVGGFGVSPLDGWYDSLVSSRCRQFWRIIRPSSNSTLYDRGPDDLMTLPLQATVLDVRCEISLSQSNWVEARAMIFLCHCSFLFPSVASLPLEILGERHTLEKCPNFPQLLQALL